MRNYRTILLFIVLLLFFPFTTAQGADKLDEIAKKINPTLMMKDIESLSSVQFEGRQAGTVGGQKSAEFVIKRLKRLGLVPDGQRETAGTNRSWIQQQPLSATKFPDPAMVNLSVLTENQEQTILALKSRL